MDAIKERGAAISLLEEKFGLKVKICGNCKYFQEKPEIEPNKMHYCTCKKRGNYPSHLSLFVRFGDACNTYALGSENWTPREILEKKEG